MSRIEDPPTTGMLRLQRVPRWYTGRSELLVVAGVLALATTLTVGILTMEVPDGTASPGPRFFPTLVAAFLYVVAVGLAAQVWRSPARTHVADDPTEISNEMLEDIGAIDATGEVRVVSPEDVVVQSQRRPGVDWRTLGIVTAAIAGFVIVLPFAGWLLASTALFWVIAWAFGSRRWLFDIAVAAITASLLQLAFGAGLGLTLPAGILEGAAPWIS